MYYLYEYEVETTRFGKSDKFTTLVVSSAASQHEANIEALSGAKNWVRNLKRTLEGTHAQFVPVIRTVNGQTLIEVGCHVRKACFAHLVTYGEAVVPVTDQSGGAYVGTMWVEVGEMVAG